jgi:hypothetical protein
MLCLIIFVMTAQFWVRIYSNGYKGGANKEIFSFVHCLWNKELKVKEICGARKRNDET